MKDIKLVFEIGTEDSTTKPGAWNIVNQKIDLTFGSFDIKSTDKEQAGILILAKPLIKAGLDDISTTLEKDLDAEVKTINDKLNSLDEYSLVESFKLDKYDLNLNLTTSKEPGIRKHPKTDKESAHNNLEIDFDGRFVSLKDSKVKIRE